MRIHEPAMTFVDDEAAGEWELGVKQNQDPYGNAIYRFASEWAVRMEEAIAIGEALDACADRCFSEADDEGITGFMYGCAVSILSACWEHGEDLRRWHNLKIQIESEGEVANRDGGVLNPALLNIVCE